MKKKVNTIMWSESTIDWKAYEKGRKACIKNKKGNPYAKETNQWYSWNKGWNSV